jgi:plastocyanin
LANGNHRRAGAVLLGAGCAGEEGDEVSHVFRAGGSFAYRCAIHPDMRGMVKVTG